MAVFAPNAAQTLAPSLAPPATSSTDPNTQIALLKARLDKLESVLRIQASGDVLIKTPGDLRLEAATFSLETTTTMMVKVGSNLTIRTNSNVTLTASATMTVTASGTLTLRGSTVDIN